MAQHPQSEVYSLQLGSMLLLCPQKGNYNNRNALNLIQMLTSGTMVHTPTICYHGRSHPFAKLFPIHKSEHTHLSRKNLQ